MGEVVGYKFVTADLKSKNGSCQWVIDEWKHHDGPLSICQSDFHASLIRVDDGPVYDQMLRLFKEKILELKSAGDEIGIHIHTWSWNSGLSKWVQTTNPANEIK